MRGAFVCSISFLTYFGLACGVWNYRAEVSSNFYKADPCVMVLDRNGEYGCTTTHQGVTAPLSYVSSVEEAKGLAGVKPDLFERGFAVVVPHEVYRDFESFSHLLASDSVSAVLVQQAPEANQTAFSPEAVYPNRESSLHPGSNYKWNPAGDGRLQHSTSKPVVQLSAYDSIRMQNRAVSNLIKEDHPLYGVTLRTHMRGRIDSRLCLHKGVLFEYGYCDPLGGKSVWGIVRPSSDTRDTIAVMAPLDSLSFFHKHSLGGASETAGIAALVAAAAALAHRGEAFDKRLLFGLWAGEARGHAGSGRFLQDLMSYTCREYVAEGKGYCLNPFKTDVRFSEVFENVTDIVSAVSVGELGLGPDLVAHYEAANTESIAAVEKINDTLGRVLQRPDADVPGLPPGPLESFARVLPDIAAVHFSDHAGPYLNTRLHSELDDASNVNASLVCEASNALAKAGFMLATPAGTPLPGDLEANCTLVTELLYCMLENVSCPLAQSILTNNQNAAVSHFTSVFNWDSATSHAKFVRAALIAALYTNASYVGDLPDYGKRCSSDWTCKRNETCYGNGPKHKGHCVGLDVHYHDAYSAEMAFDYGSFKFHLPQSPSAVGWDTGYTEASWEPFILQLHLIDSLGFAWFTIAIGVAITALSYAGVQYALRAGLKRIKGE